MNHNFNTNCNYHALSKEANHIAMHICRNYHSIDAADMAQEVLLLILEKKMSHVPKRWLYKAIQYITFNTYKRLCKGKEIESTYAQQQEEWCPPTEPSDSFIGYHVHALPAKYKDIIELITAGYSQKEIAKRQNITATTVRARTKEAREQITQLLSKPFKKETDPSLQLLQEISNQTYRQSLNELSIQQKETLFYALQGKNVRQISNLTQESYSAIQKRLYKLKQVFHINNIFELVKEK